MIKKSTKVESVWAVICSTSITDQDTNSVSLINVLERILVNESVFKDKPVTISFPVEIVSLWRRLDDPSSGSIEIAARYEIIDPKERVINTQNFTLKFESNKERLRHRLIFGGLKLSEPGLYYFKISIDRGDVEVKIPLRITSTKGVPQDNKPNPSAGGGREIS
ncbi:MAG: hypothetical protein AAB686_02265 [Patescibacteria group bacterium]